MEFSRQKYWSGVSFASHGGLSDPDIEPASLVSPALAGGLFSTLTSSSNSSSFCMKLSYIYTEGDPRAYCGDKGISCITYGSHGLVTKSRLTICDPVDYIAHQSPLSMEFSRQEYWSEFPFPSLGDLPQPGIEPGSPVLQTDSLPTESPGKPCGSYTHWITLEPFLINGNTVLTFPEQLKMYPGCCFI